MISENGKQLKYNKIIEDLKDLISSGKLLAGEQLPSENELSARYCVSRQTVRKAIGELTNAGFVYAVHGKGTFCSERSRHIHTSKNVAVVTTYMSDYIFPRVIKGIDEALAEEGYSIILKNTRNSRSREAICLEELLQKDIEGLIIEPSKSHIYCRHLNLYEKLEEYKIPYVFIQGCYSQMLCKPNILMDDYKGGYLITKHLISQGHRHIAGVFKSDDSQGQNRHRGYVKALQEAGISYNPDIVTWFYTEDRVVHPAESMKKLIQSNIKLDAVVCYNDQIAISIIRTLQEMGVKVPSDISITGYDNSYMASYGGLKLTTIAHPHEKLGEMAAKLLLSLMSNRDLSEEDKHILVEPEIVIGNSTVLRNE